MNTESTASPRTLLLLVVCLAQFMVILDVAIVNVALPSMRSGLHFSTTGLQWVVNAYTLTFAGFLMLGGRSADLLGRRRCSWRHGAFAVCSLVCALADCAGCCRGARVQGIAGACCRRRRCRSSPLVPRRRRAQPRPGRVGRRRRSRRVLGRAARRDPDPAFSWQAIFAVNVPLGALVVLLGMRLIPARPEPRPSATST